jgi:ubiquinone/menaquinone biosynthesis C-methylase UbiE
MPTTQHPDLSDATGGGPAAAEPQAYADGHMEFRGRTFAVDRRVYLTDPELNHLVDAVVRRGRELAAVLHRPPRLVEFGLGCGSLAICVKKEFPEAEVIGLEIDAGALEVGRVNIAAHAVAVETLLSDGFAAWSRADAPDLIFGDPPWGDESTVYGDDRPIGHYHAMPAASVFPREGGRTGAHAQVLREARARGWSCEILLNAGVLSEDELRPLAQFPGEISFLHPVLGLTLLHAKLGRPQIARTSLAMPSMLNHPIPENEVGVDATGRNILAWDTLYGSTPRLVWGSRPVGFLDDFLPDIGALKPEDRVLDAAAGEGRNLAALRRLGGRLHACDASAQALRKIPAELRAGVETNVCDLRSLPFRDGYFRFVLLSDVVETLPEIESPMRELARVLAPGGHLLCNIPGTDDGIAGIDMEPIGTGSYLYAGRYFYHFFSESEARTLLDRHGLQVRQVRVCRWHEEPHPEFRSAAHLHVSRVFLAERLGRGSGSS